MHQGQAGRGTDALSRRRLSLLLFATAALGYALDRLTKLLAERHLQGRPPIEIVPGVLELRFTTNPGGAFGLFGGATFLFVGASLLVVAVILIASRNLPSPLSAVALGLILGGAVGNLTDRFLRGPGFSGEVVDFLDLQVWPVFNLADSAIVVGAGLLLVAGLRRRDEPAGR